MFYKKIYVSSLIIYNNIVYNFYLIFNILFPKYFKDKIAKIKEINDTHYNSLSVLIYAEEILQKYDIDILKLKDIYNEYINNNKVNDEKEKLIKDDDDISYISSSLNSSLSSSLNSSFYDEIDEE